MVFSDLDFLLLFLPAALVGFWLLRYLHWERFSIWFLLISSAVFYAAWRMEFLALVLASVTFNYWLGGYLYTGNVGQRQIVIIGVAGNLLLLGFFKYSHLGSI